MHVVASRSHKQRPTLGVRMGDVLRRGASNALAALRLLWAQAFPPPIDGPHQPPPVAKAAVLREAALLAEKIDAVSDKHVA